MRLLTQDLTVAKHPTVTSYMEGAVDRLQVPASIADLVIPEKSDVE